MTDVHISTPPAPPRPPALIVPDPGPDERGFADVIDEDTAALTQQAHDQMTRAITLRAAAIAIARPGFPAGDLPRVAPLPFVNLGHSTLFDYRLYASTVWSAALALQYMYADWRHQQKPAWSAMTSALVAGLGSLFGIFLAVDGLPELAFIVVVVAFICVPFLRFKPNVPDVNPRARAYRREQAQRLLAGIATHAEHLLPPSTWIDGGDGRIGGDRAPVLMADQDDDFPGFGYVQVRQSFTAPVKPSSPLPEVDPVALRRAIGDRIANAIVGAGFPHVTLGEVVVVHGDSIRLDSPWLAADHTPRLWLPIEEIAEAERLDPRASVRAFLAIQILFPQHETSATLFVRSFRCGHAASIEIALATLGPLSFADVQLRHNLIALDDASHGPERTTPPAGADAAAPVWSTFYSYLLGLWSQAARTSRDDLSALLDRTALPLPFDPHEERELQRDYVSLRPRMPAWPGNWAHLANWREAHSLKFTSDHFGLPESRASLRILYEQVATAALDELDHRGFDISSYRDQNGQWHIHAEKIDQLVIGEKVTVHHEKPPAPAGAPPAGYPPPPPPPRA